MHKFKKKSHQVIYEWASEYISEVSFLLQVVSKVISYITFYSFIFSLATRHMIMMWVYNPLLIGKF